MELSLPIKLILSILILQCNSTTHWYLNQEGRIQPQMDSIYQLRRPYDFLALIQQEHRAQQVEELKKELLIQKAQIDKNEDKDTQLEMRIYRTYTDCVLAGRPLTEFDLHASTTFDFKDANINIADLIGTESIIGGPNLEPDCTLYFDLDFSMFSLEHLKAFQNKDNLTMIPENDLVHLEGEEEEGDDDHVLWGHKVAIALQSNSSSWILHTLATQYWRVKGDSPKAVECVRRALFLSPREYRHIPLLHLGNILHRSQYSGDAAIVLHAALDHNKQISVIHSTLGSVYATLGYYDVSVQCLENALHISAKDQNLKKLKHAVLCHAHLENALERQLQSLQRTLNELREYQKKHDEWLSLQQKLLLEQATPEMKLESRLEYEEQKIRESTDGRGQDCFQYQQDGHTFLSCNMRRDQLEQQGSSTDLLLDLQSLLHTVESEAMRLGQQVLRRKPALHSTVLPVVPLVPSQAERAKVSPGIHVSRVYGENFPDQKQCEDTSPLPQWDEFPSVFLPPENKGVTMESFLDDLEDQYDEFASTPECAPVRDHIEDIDDIPGVKERFNHYTMAPDRQAKGYLAKYRPRKNDVELGPVLAAAINQVEKTDWSVWNLAGLYWRAAGDFLKGIECLRNAVASSPPHYLDVPLVNLASLLYKGGHIDDALTLTIKAIEVNDSEPETNFLLANLYFGKGNLTGAWYHYEMVLTADPTHEEAQQYFTALACHIKNPQQKVPPLPTCINEGDEESVCCSSGHDDCSPSQSITSSSSEAPTEEGSGGSGDEQKQCLSPRHEDADALVSVDTPIEEPPGEESSHPAPSEAAAIEDDSLPDVLLRVREKSTPTPTPPPPSHAHACEKANKLNDIKPFTSTWLSVSAKNIDVSDYLSPLPKEEDTALEEPFCKEDFPSSMRTLDHLSGVMHRAELPHFPELGLKEAFQTLAGGSPQPMDLIATRIARSLKEDEDSWVVPTVAALYWRVLGNGARSVDCLRQALHYAPRDMKDVPLISLANILHRSGLLNGALVACNMALEISQNVVVIHFTMANIYTAKGDLEKALAFYQSTLSLQSTFEPARERARVVQCSLNEGT